MAFPFIFEPCQRESAIFGQYLQPLIFLDVIKHGFSCIGTTHSWVFMLIVLSNGDGV